MIGFAVVLCSCVRAWNSVDMDGNCWQEWAGFLTARGGLARTKAVETPQAIYIDVFCAHLIQFMRSLHIHTDSVGCPYVTGLSPRAAGHPAVIVGRGSCLNCFSLHSSALTSSSKMAGSSLIDCNPTRICCQNCVKCEFHPFLCVPTKYLTHTLCTPTESCRAWSTAPRCLSGIEYKNQDVTAGCAWPCRVTTFQGIQTDRARLCIAVKRCRFQPAICEK